MIMAPAFVGHIGSSEPERGVGPITWVTVYLKSFDVVGSITSLVARGVFADQAGFAPLKRRAL
jgi:hypothetical protein